MTQQLFERLLFPYTKHHVKIKSVFMEKGSNMVVMNITGPDIPRSAINITAEVSIKAADTDKPVKTMKFIEVK